PIPRMSEKYPIFKYPVMRGLGTLGQAMQLGYKALEFSANTALTENEPPAGEKPASKPISSAMMAITLILNFAFFIALYKFVPLFLATKLGHLVPSLSGRFATNMTDGIIRMLIFLGFMFAISLGKEIHRVFEYHGAEHKVVFNYESGQPVNVEN